MLRRNQENNQKAQFGVASVVQFKLINNDLLQVI